MAICGLLYIAVFNSGVYLFREINTTIWDVHPSIFNTNVSDMVDFFCVENNGDIGCTKVYSSKINEIFAMIY